MLFHLQGSSPQATSLFGEIRKKLRELPNTTANAISSTESSGVLKPTPTVDGKVEQARQWLTNPFIDDKGLGENIDEMVACYSCFVSVCFLLPCFPTIAFFAVECVCECRWAYMCCVFSRVQCCRSLSVRFLCGSLLSYCSP